MLSVGNNKSCVVTDTGVKCWGHTFPWSNINPIGVDKSSQVMVGRARSCSLSENKETINCWGFKSYQINLKDTFKVIPKGFYSGPFDCIYGDFGYECFRHPQRWDSKPKKVSSSKKPVKDFTLDCQIFKDNSFDCPGMNGKILPPLSEYPKLSTPIKLSSKNRTACVIDQGKLVCWGGYIVSKNIPSKITNPDQVTVGKLHACVIQNDEPICWGSNYFGQISIPSNLKKVKKIFAGHSNTCAIDMLNKLQCWGDKRYGKNIIPKDMLNVKDVSIGKKHICGSTLDDVKCWGENKRGQTNVPLKLSL